MAERVRLGPCKARTVSRLIACGLAASGVAAPGAAVAQGEGQPTAGFEDIIVTAQRRAERLQDVPVTVSALGQAQLESRFSRDLLDLGSIAPNLIVDPILGNGTAAISIRGIQLNDVEKSFDPPVGVYLDGVYLASTTGALLQIFDAAAVEVLRGPQGTLFGRNTIGGLVNVRRNLPTGELGGRVNLTYGSFDQFDIKGVLDLPGLADGRIRTKLAVQGLTGGGYFFNVVRNRREGFNDLFMLSPMVEVDLASNLNVWLTYDYIRDRTPTRPVTSLTTANQLFGALGGLGRPAGDTAFHRRPRTTLDQKAFLTTHSVTGNLTWTLGEDHAVIALLNYRDTKESAIQEFDAVEAVLFSTIRPQQIDQFSAELRYQGEIGPVKLVAGFYYFDSSYNINQQTFFFGGEVGGTDYQQHARSLAGFAQADWEVFDDFTLSLGGRLLQDRKTACGGTGTGLPDARNYDSPLSISYGDCNATRRASAGFVPNVDGDKRWTRFTPRIGISYKLDETLFYANYSEGFRSGGFNGRGSSPSSFGPYDPETVRNWELGIKTTLLDNRFQANLAGFIMRYDNKQEDVVFPDPLAGTVTVVQNAANARLSGFEAELRAIPLEGLTVGVNLGYLRSRYENWDDLGTLLDGPSAGQLAPIDKSGFLLRRAPRFTGEVSLDYQRPLSESVTLLFNGSYAFKSRYAIVANTVSINDPNPGLIDDFGLLNGSIGVEVGNLRVSGFARNLTNASYFLHVLDVGTTFGRTAASPAPIPTFGLWSFGTINAPRTFGVDLLFRF